LGEAANSGQWARFDPELGYVLRDSIMRDGVDGSSTIARYSPTGERKLVNFADRACRINTYGDSFTQCHQVSDGETWQEHLAAHLGEPIRNFGIGGYGVFQAYRRLRRVEQTAIKTPYLVLNIWGDDPQRSLMPWRMLHMGWREARMFHGNPWTHLRVDLETGKFVEAPNPCPTPESLVACCKPAYIIERFGPHEMVQLCAMINSVEDVPQERIRKLAELAEYRFDFADAKTRARSARALFDKTANRGTLHVLDKLMEYARRDGRKLMVLLSHPSETVAAYCAGEKKPEGVRSVLDWAARRQIPCIDSLDAHKREFERFRLMPHQYVRRYYIGHYNPKGNHFFAFAIKDAVVKWLDPKPITYRLHGTIIDFRNGRYLEKGS
jgi:hypothetical protein